MYTALTFVAGEQPTTAKWNLLASNDAAFNDGTGIANNAILTAHVADTNITHEKLKSSVSFYATTTQAIPTGTETIVTTYSEVYDRGNDFNPATGVFTAPYNGDYFFAFGSRFVNLAADVRVMCLLYANAAVVSYPMGLSRAATHDPTAYASAAAYLAAGQTVYMSAYHSAAGDVPLDTAYLTGFMIGRT